MTPIKIIDDLIDILTKDPSFESEIAQLRQQRERIAKDVIRVGVLGVTSSGKSTLINALFGEELLPAEARPSSSQLVSCSKGREREAVVYFENGTEKRFKGNKLTPKIISHYGNENENKANKEKVSQIKLVSPSILLPSQVELIDSPGLDAYGLEGHEQITMETLLPTVDFCLFITTCKTNSDEKTLSVLNSIARFNKPLVIIQNMVDSVMGTPDGSKSADEVAEEHITRVQKIISKSNIKGTRVDIIQVSAKHALHCRIKKQLNETEKIWWERSNFEKLKDVLEQIPKMVSLNISDTRFDAIRTDLIRIVGQINVPDGESIPVDSTDYQSDYNALIEDIQTRLDNRLQTIHREIERFKREDVGPKQIEQINIAHNRWSASISQIISDYNKEIEKFCKKLNIASRDLRFSYVPSQRRELKVQTTPKQVKKSGVGAFFRRLFSIGDCGYEPKPVADWGKTRDARNRFLKNIESDYNDQLTGWFAQVDKVSGLIHAEIESRQQLLKEAQSRVLEANVKRDILARLNALLTEIPERKAPATSKSVYAAAKFRRVQAEMTPWTYFLYAHVRSITRQIHRKIFSLFRNKKILLYGWDNQCIRRFLTEHVGLTTYKIEKIMQGETVDHIGLGKKGSKHPRNKEAVIFVNLTQSGAAKSQISALLESTPGITSASVTLVIQDLEEVITGGNLTNALTDMNNFVADVLLDSKPVWWCIHSNPLYNVALLEMQASKPILESDEMKLLKGLESYKSLHKYNLTDNKNTISAMIRGMKPLWQKTKH